MGRKYLTVCLAVVILGVMAVSGWRLAADPQKLPHENPEAVAVAEDYAALANACWSVLDMVSSGDYRDARELLGELKTVAIPDELRYVWERYQSLSQEIIAILDGQEVLLKDIAAMIDYGQFREAERKLAAGEDGFNTAHGILEEINGVIAAISEDIDLPVDVGQPDVIMARLDDSVHKFTEMEVRLEERQALLLSAANLPVELSLQVDSMMVWLGDSLRVSGRLGDDTTGLGQRRLTLLVNGEPLPVVTGRDGSYSAYIMPGTFDGTLKLQALFNPDDDDIGVYLPGQSPVVTVGVDHYQTTLRVDPPETLYAGWETVLQGSIVCDGPPCPHTLAVWLDGSLLGSKEVDADFALYFYPPLWLPEGLHQLEIMVYPEGVCGGTSYCSEVEISRRSLTVEMETPAFSSAPGKISISGTVYEDGEPAPGIGVNLEYADYLTWIQTDKDGRFDVVLDTPWAFSLFNLRTVNVSLADHRASEDRLLATASVIMLNPVGIVMVLAVMVTAGIMLRRRFATGRPVAMAITGEPLAAALAAGAIPLTLSPSRRKDGPVIIVEVYLDTVAAIAAVSGLKRDEVTTLREFQDMVAIRIPAVSGPFAGLTAALETVLYSPHRPDAALLETVSRLSAGVKWGLSLDAA